MSGPVEVRQFLLQQDSMDPGVPFSSAGVPAQRTGEAARVSEEQVHRARLAVARGSTSAEDCRELLDMLGLIPAEDGVPPVRR
jgi:hypothetical protein